MASIDFKYLVLDNEEVVFESSAQAKLTQKDLKEIEKFIEEHNYSPEFVDIPGHIYEKFIGKAYEKASLEYPIINERYDELEVVLEQDMPKSLINLFADHIREKLVSDDTFYTDENEICCSEHKSQSDYTVENLVTETKYSINDEMDNDNFSEPVKQQPSIETVQQSQKEENSVNTTMTATIVPSKENTLYLPIKQIYFDEIIEGTKKKEYREVKPTTYKKYLKCDQRGNPFVDTSLIDMEDPLCDDINVWNNGIYPLIPNDNYKFLHLAVGYNKERDEALVEIKEVSFEPILDKKGEIFRFDEENGKAFRCENGKLCFWNIVYHLGKILNVQRTKKNTSRSE